MNLEQIIKDNKPAQDFQEFKQVLETILPFAPGIILEIGLFQCGSFRVYDQVFKPALLLGIDNTDEPLKWVTGLSDNAVILTGVRSQDTTTFDQVLNFLDGHLLDLLVIDGGHTFIEVSEDFYLYSRLVRDGGLVVLHDINVPDNDPSFCEVQRFWKSIRDDYRYQEFIHTVGTGLMYWECADD